MRFIKTIGGTLINFDEVTKIKYNLNINQSYFYVKNEFEEKFLPVVFYENIDIEECYKCGYHTKLNQIILQEIIDFFNKNVFGIYDIEKNKHEINRLMAFAYEKNI